MEGNIINVPTTLSFHTEASLVESFESDRNPFVMSGNLFYFTTYKLPRVGIDYMFRFLDLKLQLNNILKTILLGQTI